uniref:Putative secreted protein n=1 Tax=Anopheles darlingi TaxID=43151 RepID=A0A2M4DJT4_ANODA
MVAPEPGRPVAVLLVVVATGSMAAPAAARTILRIIRTQSTIRPRLNRAPPPLAPRPVGSLYSRTLTIYC